MRISLKHIVGAALAATTFAAASFVSAENIAITGGTVHTMSNAGTIENGTVLISDGRITQVGANINIPSGYRVIDASGQVVTPGLMNSSTPLGLIEISLEASTRDAQVNGSQSVDHSVPFNAAFDVSYAFNPKSAHIPITRIEGITRAVIQASSGENIIGGSSAIVDLSGSFDTEVKAGAAMNVSLGAQGKSDAGGSEAAALIYLRTALAEAVRFGNRGARSIPDRERDSIVSQIDAAALVPVVKGDMPLVVAVSRAADIIQVLKLKNTFSDLDIILTGAHEAWVVADRIAAVGASVIINPLDNLAGSFDEMGATLHNAARLEAAGVRVAFVGSYPRLMPQGAGVAVANGMSWDGALAAMTINPATMFGVSDHYGSLQSGKDADVVVWEGDPLEVMVAPTAVIIKGEQIELTSRQTQLRDRYMDLNNMDRPKAYQ